MTYFHVDESRREDIGSPAFDRAFWFDDATRLEVLSTGINARVEYAVSMMVYLSGGGSTVLQSVTRPAAEIATITRALETLTTLPPGVTLITVDESETDTETEEEIDLNGSLITINLRIHTVEGP